MGGEKIKVKKEGKLFTRGGEGMSITEAPDVTVAGSSPWGCCWRQWKTSLGETGDTKGITTRGRHKIKERRGPARGLSLQRSIGERVCKCV